LPPTTYFELASLSRGASPASQDFAATFERGRVVVAVVADGAGGTGAGLEAAKSVLQAVKDVALGTGDAMDLRVWPQTLAAVDARLLASKAGGQTTAVVVACDAKRAICSSVGDSMAWRLRAGHPEELTREQRRKPLLGGRALPAHSTVAQVQSGDLLLLATDGLHKYAPLPRIAAMAGSKGALAETVAKLADLPRLPSGGHPDDIGLVLIRLR
jgi:serine/threonine protein phosphatase PrpC